MVKSSIRRVVPMLVQYNQFRAFVKMMLDDKKKMMFLNIGVISFSIALVAMGIFLYP